MDDKIEPGADQAEYLEHVPDQPGEEEGRPGPGHSQDQQEGRHQPHHAAYHGRHEDYHHEVSLLLQHVHQVSVDLRETVHLNDRSLEPVVLTGVEDPPSHRGSYQEEVGGGEESGQEEDESLERSTAPASVRAPHGEERSALTDGRNTTDPLVGRTSHTSSEN